MKYKIACPAKINLNLKIIDKKGDYHEIESTMQAISLFDYILVDLNKSGKINFTSNSNEIPYSENNLIIKGISKYYEHAKIEKPFGMDIYLEKNIPIAAGLAGGSSDCAGIIYFLNTIYKALNNEEIMLINSKLGSDINFCYIGSKALCKGKGDDITKLPFEEFSLSVVKPRNLKISTKEAYQSFDNLNLKSDMENDLEFAMVQKYNEIKKLHDLGFQMSGSGPSFFIKKEHANIDNSENNYQIFENLKSINKGVSLL